MKCETLKQSRLGENWFSSQTFVGTENPLWTLRILSALCGYKKT